MELGDQDGFLEELLAAPRRESSDTTWSNSGTTTFSSHGGGESSDQHFFPSTWGFDSFEENPVLAIPISSNPSPFLGFSTLLNIDDTNLSISCPFSATTTTDHGYPNFVVDHHEVVLNNNINGTITPLIPASQEAHYPQNSINVEEDGQEFCKVEILDQQNQPQHGCSEVVVIPSFNIGVCGDKKGRPKKLEGQPSKNLMAERRRRKRLNDRLSMLRSIVPKISKMDRTSILGDTIDYMKELLERISKLQEGIEESTNDEQVNLLGISKEVKPNEALVRNSPKFDVDRREMDTRIDICCAAKPGLLLSTVKTIESLGLEIQQCVISCFNDFSLQASCSEGAQQRTLIGSEEIKQAIFRNAGYGGRCL